MLLQVHVALVRVVDNKTDHTRWHIFQHLVQHGAPLSFNLYGQSARDLSRKYGWVIPNQY